MSLLSEIQKILAEHTYRTHKNFTKNKGLFCGKECPKLILHAIEESLPKDVPSYAKFTADIEYKSGWFDAIHELKEKLK